MRAATVPGMTLRSLVSASVLLCAGCATDPAPPAHGSTSGDPSDPAMSGPEVSSSGAPGSTSGEASTEDAAEVSSSSGDPALQPIELDREWVEGLEGAWLGPVSGTPLGNLPQFFWEFAWTQDDALVGVADGGMGFRFEFEFAEQDGQWTLIETGTLPGNMTQSYVLHPVARDGDLVRFEVLDQPGYLQVDILPGEGSFEMAVFVRGEAHGVFDLGHPS